MYVPLIKNTGRQHLATVIVFIAIGLWHDITWQYFIWGCAHGGALVLFTLFKQTQIGRAEPTGRLGQIATACAWSGTLIFVATLSTFANLPSLGHGWFFWAI